MSAIETKPSVGPKGVRKSSTKKIHYVLAIISAVIHSAIWILLLWKIPYTEQTVFLHYNIYFGIDLTGSWAQLLWMPLSGLVILIVNTIIVMMSKTFDKSILLAISIITLSLQCVLLLASLLVVLLNA